MVSKAIQSDDGDPRKVLSRGSIYLTEATWERVRADAQESDRPESYILREILAIHYNLPRDLVHPPARGGGRR